MPGEIREQFLKQAVEELLLPLARLCVGRGLPFAQAEALFKRAYVAAARSTRQEQGLAGTRDVSQVAVATGLHRREVRRIRDAEPRRAVQRPAPATQLVRRWLSKKTAAVLAHGGRSWRAQAFSGTCSAAPLEGRSAGPPGSWQWP